MIFISPCQLLESTEINFHILKNFPPHTRTKKKKTTQCFTQCFPSKSYKTYISIAIANFKNMPQPIITN